MDMQTQTPVIITAHGLWDEAKPQMGRFLEVQTEGTDDKFRYSVPQDLELPPIGTRVTLLVHFFKRPEARTSRDGEAYVRWTEKRRVVALKAAA